MFLAEKQEVETTEEVGRLPSPASSGGTKDASAGPDISAELGGQRQLEEEELKVLEKRLVRKLDARMAILVLINILNYIDRTNISSARLQGFEQDLHLEGQQYSVVLSILFVGYIIMQIPWCVAFFS